VRAGGDSCRSVNFEQPGQAVGGIGYGGRGQGVRMQLFFTLSGGAGSECRGGGAGLSEGARVQQDGKAGQGGGEWAGASSRCPI